MNYREIYSKEIDSLNDFNERDKVKKTNIWKSNINDMHAKGKLSAALYRFEKKNFSLL
jgi:hypothetical protein